MNPPRAAQETPPPAETQLPDKPLTSPRHRPPPISAKARFDLPSVDPLRFASGSGLGLGSEAVIPSALPFGLPTPTWMNPVSVDESRTISSGPAMLKPARLQKSDDGIFQYARPSFSPLGDVFVAGVFVEASQQFSGVIERSAHYNSPKPVELPVDLDAASKFKESAAHRQLDQTQETTLVDEQTQHIAQSPSLPSNRDTLSHTQADAHKQQYLAYLRSLSSAQLSLAQKSLRNQVSENTPLYRLAPDPNRNAVGQFIYDTSLRIPEHILKVMVIAWYISYAIAVVGSIMEFYVGTLPQFYNDSYSGDWEKLDYVFSIIFTIDLVCRFLLTPWRQFLTDFMNYLDILALLPFYMSLFTMGVHSLTLFRAIRLLRIFRIFRLFHVNRYWKGSAAIFDTFRASKHMAIVLIYYMAIFITIMSACVFFIERGEWSEKNSRWETDGTRSKFDSLLTAYWWCVVTVATIGYGDIVPKTPLGRFFGVITMLTGVLMVASVISVIGTHFKQEWHLRRFRVGDKLILNASKNKAARSGYHATMRYKIHRFLDGQVRGVYSRAYHVALIVLVICSVVFMVIQSYQKFDDDRDELSWSIPEYIYTVIFTVDLLLRIVTAPNPFSYIFKPRSLFDLVALLPFYLDFISAKVIQGFPAWRAIRLMRIFRIFRLGKYSKGFRIIMETIIKSKHTVYLLVYVIMIDLFIFSSAMYYAERGEYHDNKFCRSYHEGVCVPSPFGSIPASFWWGIITISTVGFGDVVPVTAVGYVIGLFAAFTAMLALAVPIAVLGETFSASWTRRRHAKLAFSKTSSKNSPRGEKPLGATIREPRKFIREIFQDMNSSTKGKVYNTSAIFLIALSVGLLTYESLISPDNSLNSRLDVVDEVITCIFMAEYLLRLWSSESPVSEFFKLTTLIDFVAVVPSFIFIFIPLSSSPKTAPLRVVRVFRVFKVFKASSLSENFRALIRSFYESKQVIILTSVLILFEVVFFSSVLFYVESDVRYETKTEFDMKGIPDAFWLIIITVLTIGYGRTVSLSWGGKIVVGCAAVCGVFTISLPISVLTNVFCIRRKNILKDPDLLADELRKEEVNELAERDFFLFLTSHRNMETGFSKNLHDILHRIKFVIFKPVYTKLVLSLHIMWLFLSFLSVFFALLSSAEFMQTVDCQVLLLSVQSFLLAASLPEWVIRSYCHNSSSTLLYRLLLVIDFVSYVIYFLSIFHDMDYQIILVIRLLKLGYLFELLPNSKYKNNYKCVLKIVNTCSDLVSILFVLAGVIAFFFSFLIWYAERGTWEDGAWRYSDGTKSDFQNVFDGLWWAIVTMATVGYGDLTPRSPIGQAIASCAGMCGVLVLAFPSAIISSRYNEIYIPIPLKHILIVDPPVTCPSAVPGQPGDGIGQSANIEGGHGIVEGIVEGVGRVSIELRHSIEGNRDGLSPVTRGSLSPGAMIVEVLSPDDAFFVPAQVTTESSRSSFSSTPHDTSNSRGDTFTVDNIQYRLSSSVPAQGTPTSTSAIRPEGSWKARAQSFINRVSGSTRLSFGRTSESQSSSSSSSTTNEHEHNSDGYEDDFDDDLTSYSGSDADVVYVVRDVWTEPTGFAESE